MPTFRSPRSRRPVLVVLAMILATLGLIVGQTTQAGALPLDTTPRPVLTLPTDVTFVHGHAGDSYTLDADGDPVPTISVTGLPPGLHLTTYDDGTALLHGTPTGPAGVTTVEVRAASADAVSYQLLTVTIQQPPTFVGEAPLAFADGAFSSVTIRTTGFPAPGIGLDGDLPAGLVFDDNGDGTATISGTPLDGPGSAPITLTAVNEVADISLTTSVEVAPTPDSSMSTVPDSSHLPIRQPTR